MRRRRKIPPSLGTALSKREERGRGIRETISGEEVKSFPLLGDSLIKKRGERKRD